MHNDRQCRGTYFSKRTSFGIIILLFRHRNSVLTYSESSLVSNADGLLWVLSRYSDMKPSEIARFFNDQLLRAQSPPSPHSAVHIINRQKELDQSKFWDTQKWSSGLIEFCVMKAMEWRWNSTSPPFDAGRIPQLA